MTRNSPSSALVVTVGRARGALAAVRALRAAGWTVGVGTPDGGGMVTASRACAASHVVARPRGDSQDFLDGVRRAIGTGGYEVVFGGGDDWALALATYRDQVPALVAHPDVDVVAAGIDKLRLTEVARAAGLAVPRTELAGDDALAGWAGPVVVKCRTHWFAGQQQRQRIEARRFPDAASARSRVQQLHAAGFDAVLQAPVDGQLTALIGLVHEGELLGPVQQVTTGLWPTPSGVSSRAHTVPADERLVRRATELLRRLGWNGLVELQFLVPPGGPPHLIDLNGRFYGSMALALSAGGNLADAWARQVTGRPLPALPAGRAGVRYVWAAGDLRRALQERRGGLLTDLTGSLRWIAAAERSVVDLRDPGPALHLLTARLRRTWRPAPTR